MSDPAVVLVLAPNWLGDAVMALPALADVRRRYAASRLVVAARGGVLDLMRLVPRIDGLVPLTWRGSLWQRADRAGDAGRLKATGAELAILFPNSFASAWLLRQAGTPERWGYASDARRRLLTRAVARPRRAMHQGAYYQWLVRELGIDNGPLEPELSVPAESMEEARALLASRGWDGRSRLAVLAPGAAYGTAKQWLPAHVIALARTLVAAGTTCALVGSGADAAVTGAIVAAVPPSSRARVIDLAGRTSLAQLAAVLACAHVCVTNDSGAMHVAAAVGAPLVAIFGPTIVEATRPLTRQGGRAQVLTEPVWCRPCMLRECPIDHRCMSRITPERVIDAMEAMH